MASENNPRFSRKYLRFEFYTTQQSYVNFILTSYSQLRDYYKRADWNPLVTWGPLFVVGDVVAKSTNSTLISVKHPEYNGTNHPTLVNLLQIFDVETRTVNHYWNRQYSGGELPVFVPINKIGINFCYCDYPQRRFDSTWDFSFFTVSFDCWTWLWLSVALCLVSFLAFTNINEGSTWALFSTLSSLISSGTSGITRKQRYSKLFILWMMCSLVLVIFYSGHMTSSVISPLPEFRIQTFEELKNKNFTMIYGDLPTYTITNETIAALSKNTIVRKEMKILQNFINTALFKSYEGDKFILALINNGKMASIMGWPFVMWAAKTGMEFISKTNSTSGKTRKKKCFIGKEIIPLAEIYMAFIPPRSAEVGQAFQWLMESGIFTRWYHEIKEMSYSSRVQDRARFKSPTNMVDIKVETIVSLAMEGRMITIFKLWIFTLVGSLACFCLEVLWINYRLDVAKLLKLYYFSRVLETTGL